LPDHAVSGELGDDLDRFSQRHFDVPAYSSVVALRPSCARRLSHWLGR
jgi:hypothetical protein